MTMSTKSTIKYREATDDAPGFHLYDDVIYGADRGEVYLEISGIHAEMSTLSEGGVTVTLALPRDLARELGLLPKEQQ
jgi:hypothetical protein